MSESGQWPCTYECTSQPVKALPEAAINTSRCNEVNTLEETNVACGANLLIQP